MERLTEKIINKNAKEILAYRIKCKKYVAAVQKLGKLEDLEEQCVKENSFGLQILLRKWKEFTDDIRELYEYRELENQGKILKLPVAVGDVVYEVQELRKRMQPYRVIAAHISSCGNLYGWELKDGKGVYSNINGFSEYAIGKTVFLSAEEAEAALQKMTEA